MTNTAYYDQFKTRVDVAEHIGVSFHNPVLWDLKFQELYSMDFVSLADAMKESKVKDDVKQDRSGPVGTTVYLQKRRTGFESRLPPA